MKYSLTVNRKTMKYRRTKTFLYRHYKRVLKLYGIPQHLPLTATGQEASDIIKISLEKNAPPCMICRFGENELRATVAYLNEQLGIKKNIRGMMRMESFSLEDERVKNWMHLGAGFFPSNRETLTQFAKLYVTDMKEADIIGTWLAKETRIKNYLSDDLKAIPLSSLDPWGIQNPWTSALKNKKILVIHPFEETIKKQYLNREKLFDNKNVLPEFNLLTLKAVQSAAGQKTQFKTWFEALEYMKAEINKIDFDIALIGAGAYGFFLAAHIKRINKKAVHLGGVSQLLFGIKGNRWDNTEVGLNLYNEYWVRPNKNETPMNKSKVEGGSYW